VPGYAIKSEGLGAFYGVKYIPSTGRLTVEKINDGETPVRLPESKSKLPASKRADDYRDWLFTTNRLTFKWDDAYTSNLVVEVR
jgi:hypothetical protein